MKIVMPAVLAIGLAGCANSGQVADGGAKLPAAESSPAFLDRSSSVENVSENDGLRGVLMLLDGKDDAGDFQQRVESLRSRGIVPAGWDFDAARPLSRGRLAYMVYQACKLRGGVIVTLSGPSERYCLRELQYIGMIGRGATYSPVSGMEYVAVLSRADGYLQTGKIPETSNAITGQQP
jgi:hypothetical protein